MDTSLAYFVERKNCIGPKAFHNNANKCDIKKLQVYILRRAQFYHHLGKCGLRAVLLTRRFLHNITHTYLVEMTSHL